MAIESLRSQILHEVKRRLRAIVASSSYWYTPDVVELVGGQSPNPIPDGYFGGDIAVFHLVEPGEENEFQQNSWNVRRGEIEVWVLSARRFTPSSEDAPAARETIVASSTWADGALVVARSPFDASRLRVQVGSGVTGGTLTIQGTDHLGNAITGTFDVASGRDQEIRGASKQLFATVTSATVASAAGSGTVSVSSLVTREEIQERLLADVKLVGAGLMDRSTLLADQVAGIRNGRLMGHDVTLQVPGWAVVYSLLMVEYQMQGGSVTS